MSILKIIQEPVGERERNYTNTFGFKWNNNGVCLNPLTYVLMVDPKHKHSGNIEVCIGQIEEDEWRGSTSYSIGETGGGGKPSFCLYEDKIFRTKKDVLVEYFKQTLHMLERKKKETDLKQKDKVIVGQLITAVTEQIKYFESKEVVE